MWSTKNRRNVRDEFDEGDDRADSTRNRVVLPKRKEFSKYIMSQAGEGEEYL